MFRFVLLLFCLLVPAYSCDWLLDASGCAEKVVEDAASKIIPEARDAFEEAMSQVFQKDINPLIDKLQTIFETEEQQVFADVNKTVDHIRDAIDEIVDHAAEVAEQLVNNTKAAVEEIINDAAQKMEDVEKQFFNDVSSLLNKIGACQINLWGNFWVTGGDGSYDQRMQNNLSRRSTATPKAT
mmetsp:Transcript_44305/g.104082  ORF Transcript_44305/g.104082 Transcript_44305/m.104082 type:complete len:183 (+) Transcript_44305:66-614(+)